MSRKDIEALERQFEAAFNRGDAAGVAGLYSKDGQILPPNAPPVKGAAAIEGFIKEFIAEGGTNLSLKITGLHESADLCVAVGDYEMDVRPEAGPAAHDAGTFIEVWKRQADDTWRIVADIFNSNLPAG